MPLHRLLLSYIDIYPSTATSLSGKSWVKHVPGATSWGCLSCISSLTTGRSVIILRQYVQTQSSDNWKEILSELSPGFGLSRCSGQLDNLCGAGIDRWPSLHPSPIWILDLSGHWESTTHVLIWVWKVRKENGIMVGNSSGITVDGSILIKYNQNAKSIKGYLDSHWGLFNNFTIRGFGV